MKKILWCPQHEITEEQIADLKKIEEGYEIFNLKDEEVLFKPLSQCPEIASEIKRLAKTLKTYIKYNKFDIVVMPIGSPAFMAAFSMIYGDDRDCAFDIKVQPCEFKLWFSHSVRNSKDGPDGTKIIKFKHMNFIEI